MTQQMRPDRYGVKLTPANGVPPMNDILWFPMDTGTGVTTDSTSGTLLRGTFVADVANTSSLRVNLGSVTWQAGGGLKFNSTTASARLAYDPSGDERTRMLSMFDFGGMTVGQTLYVGWEIFVPVGYTAAHGSNPLSLLSFGDYNAGAANSSGYLYFGLGSGMYPQLQYRAANASGGASHNPSFGGITTMQEGYWNSYVMEIKCTAAKTFQVRAAHGWGTTTEVASWTSALDMSMPSSGGTACPQFASDNGLRIGATRNGSTGNQTSTKFDVVLRNVWACRVSQTVPDSMPRFIVRDMLAMPCNLPRSLYRIGRIVADNFLTPNAAGMDGGITWAPITLDDMFLGWDGNTGLRYGVTEPWYFTVVIEEPAGNTRTSRLIADPGNPTLYPANEPRWVIDSTGEYVMRRDTSEGGIKFGRMNAGHGPPGGSTKGAFILSSWKNDITGAGQRSEIITGDAPCDLPQRQAIWIAARYYFDFDEMAQNNWVVFWQIKPDPSRNPALVINAVRDRIDVARCYNPSDHLPYNYQASADTGDKWEDRGVAALADWKRKWFDVCVKLNLDPRGLGGGYARIYFDDTLIWSFDGPMGFGGLNDPAEPLNHTDIHARCWHNIRWGNYPQNPALYGWVGGHRDVWIERCFVTTDTTGYTLAQIRSALQV